MFGVYGYVRAQVTVWQEGPLAMRAAGFTLMGLEGVRMA